MSDMNAMNPKERLIEVRPTIRNGRLLANANFRRIRLEATRPGCGVVGNPRIPNPETYLQVWRIEKDHWPVFKDGKDTGRKKKGYSFVEVNHGGGAGGVQRSVRDLVLAVSYGLFGPATYRIVFEAEPAVPVPAERRAA